MLALPYGRQTIEPDDIEAVVQVLKSDYLTGGPAVPAFERALEEVLGVRHAVAVGSGTAALHLSALALNLGPAKQVIVPAITFVATANAARYVGADVVFADVDPDTGLMRADDLTEALSRARNAAAVFPVHFAGQTCDMTAIASIARSAGLDIVEDASHAIGSLCGGNDRAQVGACAQSDICIFSFHPVKTIAMGEGGAVSTNRSDIAELLYSLRSHGIIREADKLTNAAAAFDDHGAAHPWYYEMPEVGYNYRASDIHCALGKSQLAKLDRFVERRKVLSDQYDTALSPLAPVVRPIKRVPWCTPAWHLYVVLIDFEATGKTRDDVMRSLSAQGIGTQVHYIPVYRQPYYQALGAPERLPGAEQFYERALSIPLYPTMSEQDVARVVQALREALSLS